MTHTPLSGLKVLDFTQNLPGPYATFLLASMGAEVVKLEPPKGDPGRFIEPFFSMVSRGKRSVVLDLRQPESRSALEALVRWADVLVEGFRPGVMERLGCGFDQAKAWNPGLIYCSVSAFGQEGPWVQHPGHDLNLQAISGLCHLERKPDGTPRGSVLPIADLSTSMTTVISICAALADRNRDGEARYLDVAMSDAVLSWTQLWARGVDLSGQARSALRKIPGASMMSMLTRRLLDALDRQKLFAMPQYGIYRTRDNRHLAVGIVDERHFWEGLCEVLGLPSRVRKLPVPLRTAMGPALKRLIAARLRRKTADHWMQRFEEAGVPVTPVLRHEEVATQPQYQARDFFDSAGHVRAPLPHTVHLEGAAPELGEHTESLLAELGVDQRSVSDS